MMFPRLAALAAILLVTFATESNAQGPLRRFVGNVVQNQPVRTFIQSRPVATVVRTIVQEKPIRSALRGSYQATAAAKSYGCTGTGYSYGSSGTRYSYGSTGTSYSYGSTGTSLSYGSTGTRVVASVVSCPCGPNCQCDIGGTPCPCPKTAAPVECKDCKTVNQTTSIECKDCKTVGTEPPVVASVPPVVSAPEPESLEFSGSEATDNFQRSVVMAITDARREGKISRINAFALRGAMHLPSFQAKVKDTVVAEAKKTGMISVSATPEEVGKIDWSKIDWVALIKTLLPIILSFL